MINWTSPADLSPHQRRMPCKETPLLLPGSLKAKKEPLAFDQDSSWYGDRERLMPNRSSRAADLPSYPLVWSGCGKRRA